MGVGAISATARRSWRVSNTLNQRRWIGRSNRQVVAIAEHLADRLKQAGHGYIPVEGKQTGDWVLADAGDVIVHIFRPEPRAFYGLEKMWALETEAIAVKPKPAKTARPRRAKKPA